MITGSELVKLYSELSMELKSLKDTLSEVEQMKNDIEELKVDIAIARSCINSSVRVLTADIDTITKHLNIDVDKDDYGDYNIFDDAKFKIGDGIRIRNKRFSKPNLNAMSGSGARVFDYNRYYLPDINIK